MKAILTSLSRAYIYGSVHISLIGSLAFYLNQSSNDFNHRVEKTLVVFFIIFIYYNFCQLIAIKDYDQIEGNEELSWVNRNMTELVFGLGFACVFLCILVFRLSIPMFQDLNFLYLVILGLLYFKIKSIPVLRNIYIGLAWYFMLELFMFEKFVLSFYFILYFSLISFIYDRSNSLVFKFLIDLMILVPFYFGFY